MENKKHRSVFPKRKIMYSRRSALSSMYINELERKIINAVAHLDDTNLLKVLKGRTDCKQLWKAFTVLTASKGIADKIKCWQISSKM